MRFPPAATSKYRKALTKLGLEFKRIKGDHELWNKVNGSLLRPLTFKTHKKEVDHFYQDSNLKTLRISGMAITDKEYLELIRSV